jgi:hypothetical protein
MMTKAKTFVVQLIFPGVSKRDIQDSNSSSSTIEFSQKKKKLNF